VTELESWNQILQQNFASIVTFGTGAVGVVLGLLGWQQRAMQRAVARNLAISMATHDSTNSKMDRLLAIVEKSAEAEGALRGRREMAQELIEAKALKKEALRASAGKDEQE